MRRLESCARLSRLAGQPGPVALACLGLLSCVLVDRSVPSALWSLIVLSIWIRVAGGVDARDLWRGLGAPLGFALAAAVVSLLQLQAGSQTQGGPVFDVAFSCDVGAFWRAVELVLVTVSCAACTLALGLLVPVRRWMSAGRQLGLPEPLVGLAGALHSGIMNLEGSWRGAMQGMRARGGTGCGRDAWRAYGCLAGSLGARTLLKAARQERGRVSRNLICLESTLTVGDTSRGGYLAPAMLVLGCAAVCAGERLFK